MVLAVVNKIENDGLSVLSALDTSTFIFFNWYLEANSYF
jgi:hypothetical protein